MLELIQKNLELDRVFDAERTRHFLNGELSVLHCHHFATLYTQLALDANETGLLADVAEETFYQPIANYFQKHNVTSMNDRVELAIQYFSAFGLGKMHVKYLGDDSGTVVLTNSHVDEGWIKKWKKYDRPVNYIGAGFIAAMFSAILGKPVGTFNVREDESIVMGAKQSVFTVYKK
jgi:hypothetical protein